MGHLWTHRHWAAFTDPSQVQDRQTDSMEKVMCVCGVPPLINWSLLGMGKSLSSNGALLVTSSQFSESPKPGSSWWSPMHTHTCTWAHTHAHVHAHTRTCIHAHNPPWDWLAYFCFASAFSLVYCFLVYFDFFVFVFVETQRRNMKLDGQAGRIWKEIKEKKKRQFKPIIWIKF